MAIVKIYCHDCGMHSSLTCVERMRGEKYCFGCHGYTDPDNVEVLDYTTVSLPHE